MCVCVCVCACVCVCLFEEWEWQATHSLPSIFPSNSLSHYLRKLSIINLLFFSRFSSFLFHPLLHYFLNPSCLSPLPFYSFLLDLIAIIPPYLTPVWLTLSYSFNSKSFPFLILLILVNHHYFFQYFIWFYFVLPFITMNEEHNLKWLNAQINRETERDMMLSSALIIQLHSYQPLSSLICSSTHINPILLNIISHSSLYPSTN